MATTLLRTSPAKIRTVAAPDKIARDPNRIVSERAEPVVNQPRSKYTICEGDTRRGTGCERLGWAWQGAQSNVR